MIDDSDDPIRQAPIAEVKLENKTPANDGKISDSDLDRVSGGAGDLTEC
jgi:hypothetical protein